MKPLSIFKHQTRFEKKEFSSFQIRIDIADQSLASQLIWLMVFQDLEQNAKSAKKMSRINYQAMLRFAMSIRIWKEDFELFSNPDWHWGLEHGIIVDPAHVFSRSFQIFEIPKKDEPDQLWSHALTRNNEPDLKRRFQALFKSGLILQIRPWLPCYMGD